MSLPRSTQYGQKKRPWPELNGRLSPYLGQAIIPEEEDSKLVSNESTYSSLSDIESWDTGSTSSVSWFDDFDSESTEKLAKELKDIDRVLFEEADIGILRPELREECKEWKDAFPHLRVNGKSVSSKSRKSESFSIISKPLSSTVNNIFYRSRFSPSPVSSILRSEISSSKWRRPTSPEYSSLPSIPSGQRRLEPLNHTFRLVKSGRSIEPSFPKPLVLPPIEQLHLESRSISATPRVDRNKSGRLFWQKNSGKRNCK